MARRGRWWIGGAVATAVAALLVAAPTLRAKPGVVTDLQGHKYPGDVTESDDGKFVTVKSPGGEFKLHRENVAGIEYTATVDEQYEARHAKLLPRDMKGRVALSKWADEHKRADLAIKALEEARQLDPANREVDLALQTARRQLDLDKAAARAATRPASGPAVAGSQMEGRRLLNKDEVNVIRQHELSADDAAAKVAFENNVVKRFVTAGGRDAKAFDHLPPVEQAMAILAGGDVKMAKDVRVLTDPAPLVEFKQRVMPVIAKGCGSTACHGGTTAGSFMIYPGQTPEVLYTNYYILQTYTDTVGGVHYTMLDRVTPERSLALQLGLPPTIGRPPHPQVPDYHPRFKDRNDPAYVEVFNWLNAFRPIAPDYGLNVAVTETPAPAATKPATTGPTTRAKPR